MNTVLERKEEAMKFVINGRTFDTATSKPLAVSRGAEDDPIELFGALQLRDATQLRYEVTLYRTVKGALFTHDHSTIKYKSGKPVVQDLAEEMTPEEAAKWIEKMGAVVLDSGGLPLPPEA